MPGRSSEYSQIPVISFRYRTMSERSKGGSPLPIQSLGAVLDGRRPERLKRWNVNRLIESIPISAVRSSVRGLVEVWQPSI
jgi:hypothetical protein